MENGTSQRPVHPAGFFVQSRLLLKKNWLSKIRMERKKLFGEIFIPILYLFILCLLVSFQKRTSWLEDRAEHEQKQNVVNNLNETIYVVPHSNFTEDITKLMNRNFKKQVAFAEDLHFAFADSEAELMKLYQQQSNDVRVAVILPSAANIFSYTIRIGPDWLLPPGLPGDSDRKKELDTCRGLQNNSDSLESSISCPANAYYFAKFLALEALVEQALVSAASGSESNDTSLRIFVSNYPKPAYTSGIPVFLRILIPLYSVIPMAQLINNLLVLIVTEKEEKIKDGLRMVGISDFAYWFSWFGVYGAIVTFFAIMFTLVMHFMNVLRALNIFILFLLFFLFGLSVITFAFALTPFFHKPKTAGIVGTLVMQFTSMIFLVQTFVSASADFILIPLRLISSLAFTTGLDQAVAHEYSGGIGWSDLLPGSKGERILYSLLFLAFDTVLYVFIAIYLDNILPNEFGVRKSPFYCFMPSFWFSSKRQSGFNDQQRLYDEFEDVADIDSDVIERVPPSMIPKEAIRIRDIKKTYVTSWMGRDSVEAVKGISLNIYEGQITAILGKNGAGKSTLFNMITGLVSPTSGGSVVFGLDIKKSQDMSIIRKMTGVCLQYDLHFGALTVLEHLEFYGRLRGLNEQHLKEEIEMIIHELKLVDRKNIRAGNLSGGQKRKLSVGIALIGDPKVILLDEPTAGVDPVSRRHLWSLLQKKKEGKVILLTTHFMDEADILADRKAIIHNGILKCMGSSLFLKNRFGVGYYLTIEMDERDADTSSSDEIINKWVPSAIESKKVVGNEAKYALPHSDVTKFPELFAEIEQKIQQHDSPIRSYGVSMTTLEEVFLKISNDIEPSFAPHESSQSHGSGSDELSFVNHNNGEQNLIPDMGVFKQNRLETFWAVSLLRFRRLIRSPQALFFMVFMPVIMIVIGLTVQKSQQVNFSSGNLDFKDSKALYPDDRNIAVSSNSFQHKNFTEFLRLYGFNVIDWSGQFGDLLEANPGVGTMAAIHINTLENGVGQADLNINGTFVHIEPIVVNLLGQFLLNSKLKVPESDSTRMSLKSHNFPSNVFKNYDQNAFYAMFLIGPGFVFTSVGMVMEIVYDREKKARNHLRVNGLSFGLYFGPIFFVFGLLALFVTLMQLSLIYIFNIAAFTNVYAFTVILILLIIYIVPSLLFSAIFSYLFNKLESAQSIFTQIASWSGFIIAIVVLVLDIVTPESNAALIVHGVFCAVDVFYIPYGVFYFTNKQHILCSFTNTCDMLSFQNYTRIEFIIILLCMLVQIPLFFLILLVVDVLKNGGKPADALATFLKLPHRVSGIRPRNSVVSLTEGQVDSDVVAERERVKQIFAGHNFNEKCVVAVQNLIKEYPTKEGKSKKTTMKKVLNRVNFMIEEGEVFGLLGHNGAGKTTAMRIIIAEESSDFGKVQLCGYDIHSNVSDAFFKLGYCPQHDALWENIKLKEHIELYAIIRGVPQHLRKNLVKHFLDGLQISEHADKRAAALSGGTKRKLSYAMSMLGAPKIVLLDEPSTGMDPQSKRFLWNTVLGTFKAMRGAMLTTHSMEEADALCTRIAIMVKGSILCIGSPQHLKSKFGTGYTLEIQVQDDLEVSHEDEGILHELMVHPSQSVTEGLQLQLPTSLRNRFAFVFDNFPDCKVNEIFGHRAVFSLPNASVTSISKIFLFLEKLKQENSISEYSFSQTTLEQVFLAFAKDNEENEEQ